MSVKIRIAIKKANRIPNGIAILKDLDKTIYTMNPAAKQKIAVRVPDWNIPQITHIPMIRKNNRSHLILLVIAMIIKVTDEAAALHP